MTFNREFLAEIAINRDSGIWPPLATMIAAQGRNESNRFEMVKEARI